MKHFITFLTFVCSISFAQESMFIEQEFDGWIPGIIQVTKKLNSITSDFQQIDVYETKHFGKMLVIDEVVMLTQYDNFAYHEMIVHVPMNAHPHPQRVLIVGGGDGGTLTEVLKYSSVQEVVLCEIDPTVIEVSKKYFPEFAESFDDSRVTIVMSDAAEYIQSKKEYFDVICVDSTDPIGPGEALFTRAFYQNMKDALTHDGIAVTQSESLFYSTDLIVELNRQNKELFPVVSYYYTLVPTYPSGTIGFSFCSKKYSPTENLNEQRIKQLGALRYYNAAMHQASFVLPEFVRMLL